MTEETKDQTIEFQQSRGQKLKRTLENETREQTKAKVKELSGQKVKTIDFTGGRG